MPNYRPIPGQEGIDREPFSNLPVDDLTMMAKERASNILMPYASMGGASLNGASLGPSVSPGVPSSPQKTINPPVSGIEDKLYQAVHPDTLNTVLETIMQLVTGKPIPRKGGGPIDPDKEYVVGEEGPEVFKPFIPGKILPTSEMTPMGPVEGRSLTYRGRLAPSFIPNWLKGPYYEEPGLESPPGNQPYTGPRPLRNRPEAETMVQNKTGTYEIPEPGWKDYGEGIRYKLGPEDTRGDEMARQRIMGLTAPGGAYIPGIGRYEGVPPTERSYYDVHPEERAIDEAAMINAPPRGMAEYERNAARMRMTPEERLQQDKYEAEQRKQYIAESEATKRAKMEYGPGSPLSQERLAHAEALRTAPSAQMEVEREKSRAHLQGIQTQVAGHLEAAKIGAGTRDQILKGLQTYLEKRGEQAGKDYLPFDLRRESADYITAMKDLGYITDEQWNKLPPEYKQQRWTEQSLRVDLKKNGMSDKDIETYVKRARMAGKI